ncbi:hypothetical protein SFRURICE_005863 [Spodoptera frugiperda]|nr:hypothetical protein SFRURICE_005863 [Spodoptera frugiperda]
MPKRNELSSEKRVEVQLLHEQGKSQVEISKTVKCSRRSLQFVIQRFYAIRSHQNIPKTGRKRITTDRQDHQLPRESLKNDLQSSLLSCQNKIRYQFQLELLVEDFRKLIQKVVTLGRNHGSRQKQKKLGINGPYNIELSPLQSGQIDLFVNSAAINSTSVYFIVCNPALHPNNEANNEIDSRNCKSIQGQLLWHIFGASLLIFLLYWCWYQNSIRNEIQKWESTRLSRDHQVLHKTRLNTNINIAKEVSRLFFARGVQI